MLNGADRKRNKSQMLIRLSVQTFGMCFSTTRLPTRLLGPDCSKEDGSYSGLLFPSARMSTLVFLALVSKQASFIYLYLVSLNASLLYELIYQRRSDVIFTIQKQRF